jgi:hypothetical protein
MRRAPDAYSIACRTAPGPERPCWSGNTAGVRPCRGGHSVVAVGKEVGFVTEPFRPSRARGIPERCRVRTRAPAAAHEPAGCTCCCAARRRGCAGRRSHRSSSRSSGVVVDARTRRSHARSRARRRRSHPLSRRRRPKAAEEARPPNACCRGSARRARGWRKERWQMPSARPADESCPQAGCGRRQAEGGGAANVTPTQARSRKRPRDAKLRRRRRSCSASWGGEEAGGGALGVMDEYWRADPKTSATGSGHLPRVRGSNAPSS